MPLLYPEILRNAIPLHGDVTPDNSVFADLGVGPVFYYDEIGGNQKTDEYDKNDKRLFHSPPMY